MQNCEAIEKRSTGIPTALRTACAIMATEGLSTLADLIQCPACSDAQVTKPPAHETPKCGTYIDAAFWSLNISGKLLSDI